MEGLAIVGWLATCSCSWFEQVWLAKPLQHWVLQHPQEGDAMSLQEGPYAQISGVELHTGKHVLKKCCNRQLQFMDPNSLRRSDPRALHPGLCQPITMMFVHTPWVPLNFGQLQKCSVNCKNVGKNQRV